MQDNKIFAKEAVNTGRQREIDVLKTFSIIMMIITHAIDDLFIEYESHLPSLIIDDYLAQSVGAQGFMVCMGIGIVYSRAVSPKTYAKRGVGLLFTGQLLNLLRYALPSVLGYGFFGVEELRKNAFLTFSSDIMQFAGLFFLCMALFAHLKLKPLSVFAVSVICNIAAMLVKGRIATGNYGLDQLLGLIVSTRTESYFPLMHWMIYPCFGILFGSILRHVKDKTAFYGVLLLPCIALFAAYYYVGICIEQPFFSIFSEWESFTSVSLTDALMQLPCQVAMFCVAYFVTRKASDKGMAPVSFISKNINRYYCVHSCLIYYLEYCIVYIMTDIKVTPVGCYVAALVIFLMTTLIVWLYDRYMLSRSKPSDRRRLICNIIILVLSIIVCIWASGGAGEYPNMYNDYTVLSEG